MNTLKIFLLGTAAIHIDETGRRLGDRFREHLRDVKRYGTDASTSKPVARLFSLPDHSYKHMPVCDSSLHHGNTETHKTLQQKLFSKLAFLIPTESTNAFHSTNLFLFSTLSVPPVEREARLLTI